MKDGRRPNLFAWVGREKPNRAEVRDYIAAMRRDRCSYCGTPSDVLDHIEARSRGGASRWDNYSAICSSCNHGKRQRSVLSYLAWLLYRDFYTEVAQIKSAWNQVGAPS